MTRKTLGKEGLPLSLQEIIKHIGENIKLARKRRNLTMQDMAHRMFITRKTLTRIEKGDPGVSIGIIASALLVLGIENDLNHLADPDSDKTGNLLDKKQHNLKKRVRKKKTIDMNF